MLVTVFDSAAAKAAVSELLTSGYKIALATTGAGAGIANMIWQVPGASSTLVDYQFPYAQTAFDRYIGHKWSLTDYSYCSLNAAVAMAQSAYLRCQRACAEAGDFSSPVIGFGLTAAASTTRVLRGGTRCYAALRTEAGIFTVYVEMQQGFLDREGDGAVCDIIALNMLLFATGNDQVQIDANLNLTSRMLKSTGSGLILEPAALPVPEIGDLQQAILVTTAGDCRLANQQSYSHKIIFPGSFNPFQYGHDQIAGMVSIATGTDILFEITAGNVDKSGQSSTELSQRALQFAERWPVVIRTDAGLFTDKLLAYPGCTGFIVGADTAKRILDTKYYDGESGLRAALQKFQTAGITFFVLARLVNDQLITTADLDIPQEFAGLFQQLPGRWDISSTSLRQGRNQRKSN